MPSYCRETPWVFMCRLYRNPKKTLLHSPTASSNAIKVHCNGIKASHNASKACKVITAQALLFWHKLCEGFPNAFSHGAARLSLLAGGFEGVRVCLIKLQRGATWTLLLLVLCQLAYPISHARVPVAWMLRCCCGQSQSCSAT